MSLRTPVRVRPVVILCLALGSAGSALGSGGAALGSGGTASGSAGTASGSAGTASGSAGTGLGSAGTASGSAGTGLDSAGKDPQTDPQKAAPNGTMANMTMANMAPMPGHMFMTTLRPPKAGDRQKADAIVTAAKAAMAPYHDYRKALADGYEIFLPNVPQSQYHFTKYAYGLAARSSFDPLKPTSLLYTKTADGGYQLVGAMYTDRVDADEDELDERIPLSIARWHQHINFCKAPPDQKAAYFGPDAKFGLLGSITTQEACEAAGGVFHPHLFGWMVHVYPYETDPRKIWSTVDDDQGHDNMDHSVMPGMTMN